MSHDAHAAPAAHSGKSVLQMGNELVSPRANVKAKSIFQNVWDMTKSIGNAAKKVVATTVDIPLGLVEAGLALPNNLVGLATKGIDRAVVQPMNWTRASINEVLNNPFGKGGHAPAAAHGHH